MSTVAYILVLIGGLNWGLEAMNLNLVNMLFETLPTVERIVYILVGLSAVWLIVDKLRGAKKNTSTNSSM